MKFILISMDMPSSKNPKLSRERTNIFPFKICRLNNSQWRNVQLFLRYDKPALWNFEKPFGNWYSTIFLSQKIKFTSKRTAEVVAFTGCCILEHLLQKPVYTMYDSLAGLTSKKLFSKARKASTNIKKSLELTTCPECGGPMLVVVATSGSIDEARKRIIKKHKCASSQINDKSNNKISASKKEFKSSKSAKITPIELAQLLCREKTVVLTGAGLSVAAGIPSFRGTNGFRTTLGINGEDASVDLFPQRLLTAPEEIAIARGSYMVSLMAASPTYGHKILKIWEDLGIVSFIITINTDKLHHKAGSQKVIQIGHQYEADQCLTSDAETWKIINEATMLVVIGLSRDRYGLVLYAADKKLKIVVISPDRVAYLDKDKFWLCGDAQDTLKKTNRLFPLQKLKCSQL